MDRDTQMHTNPHLYHRLLGCTCQHEFGFGLLRRRVPESDCWWRNWHRHLWREMVHIGQVSGCRLLLSSSDSFLHLASYCWCHTFFFLDKNWLMQFSGLHLKSVWCAAIVEAWISLCESGFWTELLLLLWIIVPFCPGKQTLESFLILYCSYSASQHNIIHFFFMDRLRISHPIDSRSMSVLVRVFVSIFWA